MEDREREMIRAAIKTNHELKKLYEEHIYLEDQLSRLENRPFLTTEEEIEEKLLKRKKLSGVDRMMRILADRSSVHAP